MQKKIQILREITPLTSADCFAIFSRTKTGFDYPLHYHDEFELNFIRNAKGAKRVIGDHVEEVGEYELVLIGPNLEHAWYTHKCTGNEITEVTIQFHKDLFDDRFLRRNQLRHIRNMLENSLRGLLFSYETASLLAYRIMRLNKKDGFDSLFEFMSILNELSIARHTRTLSNSSFNNNRHIAYNSRRIERVMEYMNEHFSEPISLAEVAGLTNMAESAFSRFFKARTGMTFIDSLTEIRLGHASRLLIDTTQSISEVAYETGFNNISNFNRIFKKRKGCTPKEFKKSYSAEERLFF
ncbi:MAG TPA: AraC family transcriptional regulator [Sediminibacterium sp.]